METRTTMNLGRLLVLLSVVSALACTAKPTTPGATDDSGITVNNTGWALKPGINTMAVSQEIDGETVEREVLVVVPREITEPIPALFAFHGAGGENNNWVGQLKSLVNSGAFIGVYPQGHEGYWALGPEPSTADDVAFVNAIVEALMPNDWVDAGRLYALGNSNGAGMAHRMGIDTSHFRAFAALATALDAESLPAAGEHTESVLQIHGMDDGVCPYTGGASPVGHDFVHSETSATIWAEAIGCTGEPVIEDQPSGDRWMNWTDCPEGREVQHIGLAGQGHGIPDDFMDGLTTFVWDFLSAH